MRQSSFGQILAAVMAAAMFFGAIPARADDMPLAVILQNTREARLAGDKLSWLIFAREAVQRAPEHQDLLFSLARAEAAHGNTDKALAALADGVRRGGGFDLAAAPELAILHDHPRFKAIEAQNAANRKPVGRADLHVEFPDPGLAPEGIAYDHAAQRFFVGSLRGEVWQVAADRKPALFLKAGSGLREVLGLKVDAARNLLWCVDGVFPDFPPSPQPKPDAGTTAINAFGLKDAVRATRVVLDERPTLHGFNDLALARNGDVYVTDTAAQSVYLLKAGASRLERFFTANDLTFVNGLVLSPDEKTLFVAHVEGISAIDVATRARKRLAIGPDMAVGSIDGLAEKDGALIAVQNSANLARVVRLHLDETRARVTKLDVLAARGPLDLGATTGVVVGDAFYVVASAPAGPGAPPPNPRILRIPL